MNTSFIFIFLLILVTISILLINYFPKLVLFQEKNAGQNDQKVIFTSNSPT